MTFKEYLKEKSGDIEKGEIYTFGLIGKDYRQKEKWIVTKGKLNYTNIKFVDSDFFNKRKSGFHYYNEPFFSFDSLNEIKKFLKRKNTSRVEKYLKDDTVDFVIVKFEIEVYTDMFYGEDDYAKVLDYRSNDIKIENKDSTKRGYEYYSSMVNEGKGKITISTIDYEDVI